VNGLANGFPFEPELGKQGLHQAPLKAASGRTAPRAAGHGSLWTGDASAAGAALRLPLWRCRTGAGRATILRARAECSRSSFVKVRNTLRHRIFLDGKSCNSAPSVQPN